MALNSLGTEKRTPIAAPVTLPKLEFRESNIEAEMKEAAAKVAERKIIRAGIDAWQAINKAETFEGWKAIGKALAIGRAYALKVTGANAPMGRNYCAAFNMWVRGHGFERMQKSVRSTALELHENISAIEAWRATLTEKQRRRRVHPLSNVAAWKKATGHKTARAGDRVKAAGAAWRRFVTLMEALPAEQAVPMWKAAHEQATTFLGVRGHA